MIAGSGDGGRGGIPYTMELENQKQQRKKGRKQARKSWNGTKLCADVGAIRPWNDMVASGL